MNRKSNDIAIGVEYRRFISSGLLALYSSEVYEKSNKALKASNLFLGNWLIRALKQKRYQRELADNITLMIELHKTKRGRSNLVGIFELHHQENKTTDICLTKYDTTALSRIQLTSTELKLGGWEVSIPLDYDPVENGPYQPLEEKEAFTLRMDWNNSIDGNGGIKKALRIYSTERLQEIVDAFFENGFYVFVSNKTQSDDRTEIPKWYYCLDIYPHDEPKNGIEIPTKCKI